VRRTGFCRFVPDRHVSEYESIRTGPKSAPAKSMLAPPRHGQHFYIVKQGWAALFGMVPDGRTKITGILVAGDMAPLSSLFGASAGLNVRAITPVAYCTVDVAAFHRFLCRHPDLVDSLYDAIGQMLSRCEQMAVHLGALTAKEAMLYLLHGLAGKVASGADLSEVTLPLRVKLLAEFVGVTPVHAGRLLNELEEAQILRRTEEGLVLYRPALARAAAANGPAPV